jgi:hypothetical protein
VIFIGGLKSKEHGMSTDSLMKCMLVTRGRVLIARLNPTNRSMRQSIGMMGRDSQLMPACFFYLEGTAEITIYRLP